MSTTVEQAFIDYVNSGEKLVGKVKMIMCDVGFFEPLNPVTLGHLLAVPNVLCKDFCDYPAIAGETMAAIGHFLREKGIQDKDFNIITSKGKSATQSVFQLHIHIVPRTEGDNLKLPWTEQKRR